MGFSDWFSAFRCPTFRSLPGGRPRCRFSAGRCFFARFFRAFEVDFGASRQLAKDERVGAPQLVFDFPRAQRVPPLERDPVGLRQVGAGNDAIDFEQFVKTLGAAVKPENAGAYAFEVGHGEHLAAEVAIASPIDEVMAPVDRFFGVGQGQADLANAFVVHGG